MAEVFVARPKAENVLVSQLDAGQAALVRLGALVALDAALVSYIHVAAVAREAGITNEELVGTLVAVIPDVGGDRAVSAAHNLGLAIGYDVEAALEAHNHSDSQP